MIILEMIQYAKTGAGILKTESDLIKFVEEVPEECEILETLNKEITSNTNSKLAQVCLKVWNTEGDDLPRLLKSVALDVGKGESK